MTTHPRLIAMTVAMALTAAACGGGSGTSEATAPDAAQAEQATQPEVQAAESGEVNAEPAESGSTTEDSEFGPILEAIDLSGRVVEEVDDLAAAIQRVDPTFPSVSTLPDTDFFSFGSIWSFDEVDQAWTVSTGVTVWSSLGLEDVERTYSTELSELLGAEVSDVTRRSDEFGDFVDLRVGDFELSADVEPDADRTNVRISSEAIPVVGAPADLFSDIFAASPFASAEGAEPHLIIFEAFPTPQVSTVHRIEGISTVEEGVALRDEVAAAAGWTEDSPGSTLDGFTEPSGTVDVYLSAFDGSPDIQLRTRYQSPVDLSEFGIDESDIEALVEELLEDSE